MQERDERDPDELLLEEEVGRLLKASARSLQYGRKGRGSLSTLPFIVLGPRRVRYRRRDVLSWVAAHEVSHGS